MSADQNRNLDRLLMLLGPLGAVAVALWWVGVYKGQTDARLSTHDASLSSLTAIVAVDHDVVTGMKVEIDDLHSWLKNKTEANQAAGK